MSKLNLKPKLIIALSALIVFGALVGVSLYLNRPKADVAGEATLIIGTVKDVDSSDVMADVTVKLELKGKINNKNNQKKNYTTKTDNNGFYQFSKPSVFGQVGNVKATLSSTNRKPRCTFTDGPHTINLAITIPVTRNENCAQQKSTEASAPTSNSKWSKEVKVSNPAGYQITNFKENIVYNDAIYSLCGSRQSQSGNNTAFIQYKLDLVNSKLEIIDYPGCGQRDAGVKNNSVYSSENSISSNGGKISSYDLDNNARTDIVLRVTEYPLSYGIASDQLTSEVVGDYYYNFYEHSDIDSKGNAKYYVNVYKVNINKDSVGYGVFSYLGEYADSLFPNAKPYLSSTTLNGKIYLLYGIDLIGLRELKVITFDTTTNLFSNEIPVINYPNTIYGNNGSIVSDNNRLYVAAEQIGGSRKNIYFNTIDTTSGNNLWTQLSSVVTTDNSYTNGERMEELAVNNSNIYLLTSGEYKVLIVRKFIY